MKGLIQSANTQKSVQNTSYKFFAEEQVKHSNVLICFCDPNRVNYEKTFIELWSMHPFLGSMVGKIFFTQDLRLLEE
jgi:hypothetical protein